MPSQRNVESTVEVGDEAPDFQVKDMAGKTIRFRQFIGNQKTLLLFYRGGWCKHCNAQFESLMKDHARFVRAGAKIVAVSSEDVEKGKEFSKKLNLPFVLLSDTGFDGIERYGVKDSNPSEKTKARGIYQLAKPSAFIIDRNGIVRYKYVSKSPSDRPNNKELLNALAELESRGVK